MIKPHSTSAAFFNSQFTIVAFVATYLIIGGRAIAHSGAGAVAEGEPPSVAIFEKIANPIY